VRSQWALAYLLRGSFGNYLLGEPPLNDELLRLAGAMGGVSKVLPFRGDFHPDAGTILNLPVGADGIGDKGRIGRMGGDIVDRFAGAFVTNMALAFDPNYAAGIRPSSGLGELFSDRQLGVAAHLYASVTGAGFDEGVSAFG